MDEGKRGYKAGERGRRGVSSRRRKALYELSSNRQTILSPGRARHGAALCYLRFACGHDLGHRDTNRGLLGCILYLDTSAQCGPVWRCADVFLEARCPRQPWCRRLGMWNDGNVLMINQYVCAVHSNSRFQIQPRLADLWHVVTAAQLRYLSNQRMPLPFCSFAPFLPCSFPPSSFRPPSLIQYLDNRQQRPPPTTGAFPTT
ncbi:hypothetical protein F5Y14DRAFT_433229 [Nemania sp. NC0429]|nr:hypothetical protein F5Y14DRAFT_433229 [Nemania sp. NC0429]